MLQIKLLSSPQVYMKPGAGQLRVSFGAGFSRREVPAGALSMVREEEDLSRVMSNYEQEQFRDSESFKHLADLVRCSLPQHI